MDIYRSIISTISARSVKMVNVKYLFPYGLTAIVTVLILGLSSCGVLEPEEEEEKDTNAPTITLEGDNPDTIYAGTGYDDPGCTADDPEDGDITSSVTVDYDTLDTAEAEVGIYTITYSVSDKAGNSDDAKRKVVVIDTETTTTTTDTVITNASLSSCPVTFDDTNVVYTIPSTLNISSDCKVTFGAHTKYNVKGKISIYDGGTLTILEGAELAFADNAYILVGSNENGTLKALGTEEDSIRFTNLTSGTRWGYGTSATSSGGIWFDDAAVACSLSYCVIDSATSGVYTRDAEITISNSRIANHQYFGCYFADGGTPVDSAHFVNNVITGNGEYGISIFANFAGALSGTGSVDDNTKGGILIKPDVVESDAVWKKHDAPYVVEGTVYVRSGNGATLTINPGCEFQMKDNAYFNIGESSEGTIIANGTEEDSIRFTNYTSGTKWGYGTSATSSAGIWIDDAATSNCSLTYCVIDSATSGIRIEHASATISHCRIAGNEWFGIYCYEGGPIDSAAFIENVVTGNGEYGMSIFANFAGALSGTGSFIDNTNGGILITADAVESDAVWKKHDAPYVVDGTVYVRSESDVTLTILPGCEFQLKDNAYFNIGEGETATIIANGTESDSIRFTNYTSGTKWGYGTSATSSGGIWIDDAATSNCSLTYCVIDSATSGIRIEHASATISHCRIAGNEWFGIYCYEGGPIDSAAFIENVVTGNGEYGMSIFANFAGALSGTGSFVDNTNGGILITSDVVESDAVWKMHDAPYVVDGAVHVGSGSGATLTINPGCEFELKDNAYFNIGERETGTLIADGTESDSIRFSNYSSGTKWGYGTSATSTGGFWIKSKATANTSLTFCSITEATSGIHVEYTDPTIQNCNITGSQFYGIYLYECPATNIADNTFSDNGTGDIGTNQ